MRVVVLVGVIGVLTPTNAAGANARTQWLNNMKVVALGIHGYAEVNKRLARDVCDKQGMPLLSWRVTLLPFVDHAGLYEKFHLDEAWDSPHNLEVAREVPPVYCNPGAPDTLCYMALVQGPATWLADDKKRFLFTQGVCPPFALLVEVDRSFGVPWTAPDKWSYDAENPARGLAKSLHGKFSISRSGSALARADASALFIPHGLPPEALRKLFAGDVAGAELRYGWWESLFEMPTAAVAAPPFVYSAVVVLWSLWVLGRVLRRRPITSGEALLLVLGAQRLVFLIAFVTTFEWSFPDVHVVPDWPWNLVDVGGIAACFAVAASRVLATGDRVIFILLGVLLILGARHLQPDESLIAAGAPLELALGSVALAVYSLRDWRRGDSPRGIAHWLALVVALLPFLWCAYWGGQGVMFEWAYRGIRE